MGWEVVLDLKFGPDMRIVRIRKGWSQASVLNQVHLQGSAPGQEDRHIYDAAELVKQRECSIQVISGFDTSPQVEDGDAEAKAEALFGQMLHSEVLCTVMDYPSLAGQARGVRAEDIDTRGCAQCCHRLWKLHKYLHRGFRDITIDRDIEWDGDEALVYQTIRGTYSSRGHAEHNVQQPMGRDAGAVGEVLYGATTAAPKQVVLKLTWQVVFKHNSHKAVELDIWLGVIDFLDSLKQMHNTEGLSQMFKV
jgi:hypothetical protein